LALSANNGGKDRPHITLRRTDAQIICGLFFQKWVAFKKTMPYYYMNLP
jgi:hypothetical protein